MTDSPAYQLPLDPKEEPILARVLALRDELSLLKQDKSTYIKCADVLKLYDQVIEQVQQLNDLRAENGKPLESNRGRLLSTETSYDADALKVDRVLDDSFQLISLFFLTVGRNNEAPAMYVASS